MGLAAALLVACGLGEPEVVDVQAAMESEMRDLVEQLTAGSEIEEGVHRDFVPCGGLGGANWNKVFTPYEVRATTELTQLEVLNDAQQVLDDMGLGYKGTSIGGPLLSVYGEGYMGGLSYDLETSEVRFSGETDCLDNPDE